MFVIKASGEREKFDPEKIRRTCLRAGATKELADAVVKKVSEEVYDGIPTRKLLEMVLKYLDVEMPHIAARYDLKGAIMRLGPAGHEFEDLVARIFDELGYKTTVRTTIKGACVDHEIDIIARKEGKCFMVECKYHNAPGIYTGIKEVLYTYARFLDLKEGKKAGKCMDFTQPWLVCNTKFSPDSIQYASCKNMRLLGWKYPPKKGLEAIIQEKKLFPVTVLRSVDRASQGRLIDNGYIFCKDLIRFKADEIEARTRLSRKKLNEMIHDAEMVIG